MKIKRILKYVMSKYGSVTSKQMTTTKVNNVLVKSYDVVQFNYKTFSSTTQSISYDNTVDFKVSLNGVTSSNATINLQGPNRHSVKTNLKGELHIHFPDGLYTYSAIDLSGNTASGTFSVPTTATVSIPNNSLIQSWYDALSVKPSAGLWSDLNTLVNTLNTANKWIEIDYLLLLAAMETDEQRLKPLKSTSGLDATAINSPTLNTEGVLGNGSSSYLNLNWTPSLHGSKYTLNNASMGVYRSTSGTNGRVLIGISDTSNVSVSRITRAASSILGSINSTSTGVTFTGALGYNSVFRTDSGIVRAKVNTNYSGNITSTTTALSNLSTFGAALNVDGTATSFSLDTIRCLFIGSGDLQSDDILYNALNTFFTSRGMTTF